MRNSPKMLFILILFTPLLLLSQTNIIQDREVTDVIVMFKNDMVISNDGVSQGSLTDFQIKSDSLKNVLMSEGINRLSKLVPDFNKVDRQVINRTGEAVTLTDWTNVFIISVPDGKKADDLVQKLKDHPDIVYIEPNGFGALDYIPDDDDFPKQWSLKNEGTYVQGYGLAGADINITPAWDITTGSSSINIAIVDAGMQTNHPDFTGRVSGDAGDDYFHGTAVAGIAAATGDNGIGIAGVAWNVGIINEDVGAASNAVRSAYNRGADVINNSWLLLPVGRFSHTVRAAFADAYKLNTVTVASMGNEGGEVIQYPAAFGQGILTVGATTNEDEKAIYSSTGNWIDVTAPGGSGLDAQQIGDHMYSTLPPSTYGHSFSTYNLSGTSFSAPIATGLGSLLLSVNSNLYNDDIEQLIRLGVKDLGSSGFDNLFGTGRIDVKKALDYLFTPYSLLHKSSSGGSEHSHTNTSIMIFFGEPSLADGAYYVKRYEVRKTVNWSEPLLEVKVWGRGVGTNGYSIEKPNHAMGYCDIISHDNNSATLRTYVYEVWNTAWQYIGFVPTNPQNVTFNYTVLGKNPPPPSVYITGPEGLGFKEYGTWTAHPSGGYPPYSYQWYKKKDSQGYWTSLGINSSQTVRMGTESFTMKVVVTDNQSNEAEDTHYVEYLEGPWKASADDMMANSIPDKYTLVQNYPNPFNPVTRIDFGIPEDKNVKLVIYNIEGQTVTSLVDGFLNAGYHNAEFNASNLPSGVYFYKIIAGDFVDLKRMVLLK
jgi:hypothetical protein